MTMVRVNALSAYLAVEAVLGVVRPDLPPVLNRAGAENPNFRERDYLFGEKIYIILSLTAKALLAWQVFSAALVG